MDVLGFSDRQKSVANTSGALQEFQAFHAAINRGLSVLNERVDPKQEPDWAIKVFTDNIILGYPLRWDHHESVIATVAQSISGYQLGMAKDGYFIRGGMSFSDLYMDQNLVYGGALLEAYDLEHTIARDPRIVVSQRVKDLILEHFRYYAQPQYAPQNNYFLLDSDGQIFVHYLECCFLDKYGSQINDLDTLGSHKEHIEKGLASYARQPRVLAKYAWLANYHNFTISSWREKAGLSDDHFVCGRLYRPSPVNICPFLIPEGE